MGFMLYDNSVLVASLTSRTMHCKRKEKVQTRGKRPEWSTPVDPPGFAPTGVMPMEAIEKARVAFASDCSCLVADDRAKFVDIVLKPVLLDDEIRFARQPQS